MKKKFVTVQPVSDDAKDRFVNIMDSFHSCVVEQEENEMLFLASLNKCYYFTLPRGGNEHWKIINN